MRAEEYRMVSTAGDPLNGAQTGRSELSCPKVLHNVKEFRGGDGPPVGLL